MNKREDIFMEIKNISASVAAIPFVNVFTVEETYFSKLPEIITSQINVGNDINSAENLSVPEGYFESLAGNILNKIYALESDVSVEVNEISPMIAGIKNKETLKVPDRYFDELTFLSKQKQTSKIIAVDKPRSFFKYAAAAMITGLVGLGIVNIFNNDNTATNITTTAKVTSGTNLPNTILMNGSFDEALKSVSDIEIEEYLQQSGQDVNAALVASSTDDVDKLPEATDYLLDENVLENYLKKNNLKN